MIFTTLQVVRSGTPVTGLTDLENCQIDTVSLDPRMFDHGSAPYDLFNIFIPYAGLPILRNDQLQDTGVSASGFYRIANKPESFPDGHWEIQAFQPIGT